MSTRALYTFSDGDGEPFHVYKHHDGYMGFDFIARAKAFAWPLPRFEADDFAAAFVRANKNEGGGGVRLVGRAADWRTVAPPDIAYRYEVKAGHDGLVTVRQWQVSESGGKWAETLQGLFALAQLADSNPGVG